MFRKSHQKTICRNDPHIQCISADAFLNCCMCRKARICKLRKFCHHGTFLGPHWCSDLCNCTSAKKTDYMQRLSVHCTSTSIPPKGLVKTSGDHVIKKVVLASNWRGNFGTVSIQRTVWHACYQASQSTTGKSTWIQGWSSFMIPWRNRNRFRWTEIFWEMKSLKILIEYYRIYIQNLLGYCHPHLRC